MPGEKKKGKAPKPLEIPPSIVTTGFAPGFVRNPLRRTYSEPVLGNTHLVVKETSPDGVKTNSFFKIPPPSPVAPPSLTDMSPRSDWLLPLIEQFNAEASRETSVHAVAKAVRGEYPRIDRLIICDCRFPYEYANGHIRGAVSCFTHAQTLKELFECPPKEGEHVAVVVHCEFSSQRGPDRVDTIRQFDRKLHSEAGFSRDLYYPELFLMKGGYSEFHAHHKELCDPQNYISMFEKAFSHQMLHCQKFLRADKKQKRVEAFIRHESEPTSPYVVTIESPHPPPTSSGDVNMEDAPSLSRATSLFFPKESGTCTEITYPTIVSRTQSQPTSPDFCPFNVFDDFVHDDRDNNDDDGSLDCSSAPSPSPQPQRSNSFSFGRFGSHSHSNHNHTHTHHNAHHHRTRKAIDKTSLMASRLHRSFSTCGGPLEVPAPTPTPPTTTTPPTPSDSIMACSMFRRPSPSNFFPAVGAPVGSAGSRLARSSSSGCLSPISSSRLPKPPSMPYLADVDDGENENDDSLITLDMAMSPDPPLRSKDKDKADVSSCINKKPVVRERRNAL